MRATRRPWLRSTAVCALAAFALGAGGDAHAASPLLPDLVADPPVSPELQQYTNANGTRLLLRFDAFIHNQGAGVAEIRGDARVDTEMTEVTQRVVDDGGGWSDTDAPRATLRYENADGHRHWHLGKAARYSLWNFAKSAEVAPAQKVGFCLQDTERIETNGPATPVYSDDAQRFCEQDNPTIASVYMGVSAGWRDVYDHYLAFQWVDVSDVAPGVYWLRAEVDPNDAVVESNETNDPAFATSTVTLPGYEAQALVQTGLAEDAPAQLTLGATRFDPPAGQAAAGFTAPGPVEYRIETPPAHGTLDRPAGTWSSASALTYTPNPGYAGQDSFTYSARDSASAYPRNPVRATATLAVQPAAAEAVAIGGAPAQLLTGTSAQLTATVVHGPPQTTWSVDGVPGGNATVGTITPGGLYTAPASVPPRGSVTIRADGSSGGHAEIEVPIAAPPTPLPSPEPVEQGPVSPPIGPPSPMPPLLSVPKVSVSGRRVLVKSVPGRGGVVETAAMYGKRRLGLCRSKVPAGRPTVCKLSVSRRYRMRSVLLVVKLRVGDKALATRRARVP